MVPFQKKELTHKATIGEKLKQQRLNKGLDLAAVSAKLRVAERYLQAIEEGNFDELPGEVYIKKFLQLYSEFLGFDFGQILTEYVREKDVHQMIKKVEIEAFSQEREKTKRWHSFVTFNLLKNLALTILIIAGLAFLGLKINNIVAPPQLTIIEPKNNDLVIKDNYIEIVGQTEIGSKVSINGQSVMIDPDGSFKERVNLQSGLNTIKISAEKKYSKAAVVYREVMVE